jgi:Protein of unknown function (DUF3800)
VRNLSADPVEPGVYAGPLALFGGPLTVKALVRNIYSDEAGVSAPEPVSVVIALIVHMDKQWRPVADEVARLARQHVPSEFLDGFAFHTKVLLKEKKYPGWDMSRRKILIEEMMGIPQKFHIPLSYSAVKRGTAAKAFPRDDLKPFEIDHLYAFILSMSLADKYLRQYCGDEMSQIIAEDHPTMKRTLKRHLNIVRTSPLVLQTTIQRPNQERGSPRVESNRVERLTDEVLFMAREGSPLLQVADACAWGMRRYFSHNDEYRKTYLDRILGEDYCKRQQAFRQENWKHHDGTRDFDLPY